MHKKKMARKRKRRAERRKTGASTWRVSWLPDEEEGVGGGVTDGHDPHGGGGRVEHGPAGGAPAQGELLGKLELR